MINDDTTLIYGKKVWWVHYNFDKYKWWNQTTIYLGRKSETESYVNVLGFEEPTYVPTSELYVNKANIPIKMQEV